NQDDHVGGDCRRACHSRRQRLGERRRDRRPRSRRGTAVMSRPISRRHYADIYGPTTGDRVRLGDTGLIAEVETDATVYGDECKFGGGKVLRDGMGQAAGISDERALDCLITNALIIDWTGIR